MKKQKGEVDQFITQMMCILFSFVILLYSIYFLKTTIAYNHVNTVARKYILKMERQGCLTQEECDKMQKELENNESISDVSVDITPTVGEKAAYGEDVDINITCNINMTKIDLSSFEFTKEEESHEVTINKSSTARW